MHVRTVFRRGIIIAKGFTLIELLVVNDKNKKDYRNIESYRCPSYPDKRQIVCYVVNGLGFENERDKIGFEVMNLPVKHINYCHLSKTIYLADNEDGAWRSIIETAESPGLNQCDVWTREHMPSSNRIRINKSQSVAHDRHRKGYEVLYADWHVEHISSRTTLPEEEAIDLELKMWCFHCK